MDTELSEGLRASERQAAEGAAAPRVTLDTILEKISSVVFFTGGEAAKAFGDAPSAYPAALDMLTVCLVTMENGFTVVGKSAPVSPANFDAAMGRQFAHEDAVRQLWPLEGYAMRSDRGVVTGALLTLDDGGETRRFREV